MPEETQGQWSDGSLPTGRQFTIRSGNTQAVITEVGAGLRGFSVGGNYIIQPFPPDEMPKYSRGQVLLPFPNRVNEGKYTFNGTALQLPIDEVPRNNAIHGLTRWMNWNVASHEENRIVLSLILHAQEGYPFVLSLQISYTVTEGRLEVETTAHNLGKTALPYGVGHHPYFSVGTETINNNILRIPARSYFLTNERLIPHLPAVSVTGTPYDFVTPRQIGDVDMDTGFTDLIYDDDGFARAQLATADGSRSITIFMDSTHKFIQVFTGDGLPEPELRRHAIAIEAETCGTDAYNNGLGLIVLEPGQEHTSLWGVNVSL